MTTTLGVFLLLLVLSSVQGERSCAQILQQSCTDDYEARLKSAREPFCVSLTIYSKCVTNIKQTTQECRSNIFYHTIASLIPRLLEQNDCGNVSVENFSISQPITPSAAESGCELLRRKSKLSKISVKKYCGLFGDPHLRTFDENKQTCVVQGAWPMVDNRYLAVQVTNVYLLPGESDATATSKITVVIKGQKGCAKQKIYQALTHRVPAGFIDGSQETGSKECPARVEEVIKGSLIHIDICYIETRIIIRQVGQFLTFHIQMPQEIVGNTTKGLCVSGCPAREQIDYRELLSKTDIELLGRSKLTRREAAKKCMDANVSGFYLDSCLFDLLTTGDGNFSAAAKSAMDDAFSLDPVETYRDLQAYNITIPRNITTDSKVTGINSACTLGTSLFSLFLPFMQVFTSY